MPTETRLKTGLHNTSEIGRLKKVMLHRPGKELENLMPEYLERLLFDDIPYLKVAQAEHDAFAQCLRDNGAEVVYLRDLVEETLAEPDVQRELTEQFLDEAGLENPGDSSGLFCGDGQRRAGGYHDGRGAEKRYPGLRDGEVGGLSQLPVR